MIKRLRNLVWRRGLWFVSEVRSYGKLICSPHDERDWNVASLRSGRKLAFIRSDNMTLLIF